ncbi:hypothetical protein HMPREF3291_11375 [Bacillus sp. HMSC76G11]|uniref:DUF3951 domain-containing protein n=1 Tax=Metabacillus idriensis TaxID=324768 RepID=A0A6I2M9G7_9BACI|nr:hypothetical protein [Metabacillus idriensis]MRX53061.1 hypothetical protein [Metabacillus idriensis]OHR67074.1 hypothetical protein HMPREF3291_11375 [Bacillus sp. HMSC76G11]
METIFLAVILGVIAFSLYKIIRKNRKLPSNEFTPVNDIDNGLVRHYSKEIPISETKHEAPYEEKNHNKTK